MIIDYIIDYNLDSENVLPNFYCFYESEKQSTSVFPVRWAANQFDSRGVRFANNVRIARWKITTVEIKWVIFVRIVTDSRSNIIDPIFSITL